MKRDTAILIILCLLAVIVAIAGIGSYLLYWGV